jgi:hypothetical protein
MSMMDNMKNKLQDKMGGMDDAMKERYQMLKGKAQEGKLDDKTRAEYDQLRARFETHGKQ